MINQHSLINCSHIRDDFSKTSRFCLNQRVERHQILQTYVTSAWLEELKALYLYDFIYFLSFHYHAFTFTFSRVIVGILDAFHFDLRNSQHAVVNLPDAIAKKKAKGEITGMGFIY